MPALAFLAVVGFALIALLFVADATLENGSLAIITFGHRFIRALASRHDTNFHHQASARP